MYVITEQGKQVSDNLEGNLLGIIRDKSLKSALRLLSFKKRGSEIGAVHRKGMTDGIRLFVRLLISTKRRFIWN